MSDLTKMDDTELFFSVGSSRPRVNAMGGLMEVIAPMSAKGLLEAQKAYDAAVAEMRRRDDERGFPYHIPKA